MQKRLFSLLFISLWLPGTPALSNGFDVNSLSDALGIALSANDRNSAAATLRAYAAAGSQRALAIAIGDDNRIITGWSGDQALAVQAAGMALRRCEATRASLADRFPSGCEVLLAGDQWLTPTRRLLDGVGPDTPANVWRVEGKGGVLYLAGSIHVLKPALYPLPDAFEHAFSEADRIALEIDPLRAGDADRVATMQSMIAAEPANVRASLTPELMDALNAILTERGIAQDVAMRMQPAMLATQLSVLALGDMGLTPELGIDIHFARRAALAGTSILELETIREQMLALTGAPLEAQALMLSRTLEQLHNPAQAIDSLLRGWLQADADGLHALMMADFTGSPVLERMGRQLLDDRNVRMLAHIRQWLDEPPVTLVIVGAGHFGGPRGLLALLREAGYQPRQLSRAGIPLPVPMAQPNAGVQR
ncbi:MAG: TraB/GumN family protein [Pseudomonadales bacterium]|nr:TraB/GumN family protein [Pseudomonadales bacterium]MCP5182616.1 TraB/GumN family protein [Pseudomonadales bacterium]